MGLERLKQNERDTHKQHRPVVEHDQEFLQNQQADQAAIQHLVDGPNGALGGGTLANQISLMRDPSLQSYHPTIATEIGRAQGNQHLQRVLNKASTPANSTDSSADAPDLLTLDVFNEWSGFSAGFSLTPPPPEQPTTQTPHIQTKLTVNAPDDMYEQEADAVADTVMRMSDVEIGSTENGVGSKEQEQAIHRKSSAETPAVTPDIESSISSMQGGGQALPDNDRQFFESRMGQDFSNVRIHTDSNAAQTSDSLQAKAFTVGSDIAFGAGEYQPGTDAGRHLMAHELTHVVQQGGSSELVSAKSNEPAIQRVTTDDFVDEDGNPRQPTEEEIDAMTEEAHGEGESQADGVNSQREANTQDTEIPQKPDGDISEQTLPEPLEGAEMTGEESEDITSGLEAPTLNIDLPAFGMVENSDLFELYGFEQAEQDVWGQAIVPPIAPLCETGETPQSISPNELVPEADQQAPENTPELPSWGDRFLMVGGSVGSGLLEGGLEGIQEGAKSFVVDSLVEQAGKRVPYVQGFVGIAEIATDPAGWAQGQAQTVEAIGENWSKLLDGNLDIVDRFEAFVGVADNVNNLVGTISTILMIIAALSFIFSFIPGLQFLIPVATFAYNAGTILGRISSFAGIIITALKAVTAIMRVIQILGPGADPTKLDAQLTSLNKNTKDWSKKYAENKTQKFLENKVKTNKTNRMANETKPDDSDKPKNTSEKKSSATDKARSVLTFLGGGKDMILEGQKLVGTDPESKTRKNKIEENEQKIAEAETKTKTARDKIEQAKQTKQARSEELKPQIEASKQKIVETEIEIKTTREKLEQAKQKDFAIELEKRQEEYQKIQGKKANGEDYKNKEKRMAKLERDIEAYENLAQEYPDGIKYKDNGKPDFTPSVPKGENGKEYSVEIDMKGNRTSDFKDADAKSKAKGLKTKAELEADTGKKYTWHHHEDGKTMQLVPTELHRRVGHSGGVSQKQNKASSISKAETNRIQTIRRERARLGGLTKSLNKTQTKQKALLAKLNKATAENDQIIKSEQGRIDGLAKSLNQTKANQKELLYKPEKATPQTKKTLKGWLFGSGESEAAKESDHSENEEITDQTEQQDEPSTCPPGLAEADTLREQLATDVAEMQESLLPAPIESEVQLDDSASNYALLDMEEQRLLNQRAEIVEAQQDVAGELSGLETMTSTIVEGQNNSEQYSSEIEEKREKQAQTTEQIQQQEAQSDGLQQQQGGILGPVMSFLSSFISNLSKVPDKYMKGKGSDGPGSADEIGTGVEQSGERATEGKEQATEGKAVLEKAAEDTDHAQESNEEIINELEQLNTTVDEDKAEALGTQEDLAEADSLAEEALTDIASQKEEQQQVYQDSQAAVANWSEENQTIRQSGEAQFAETMAEIQELILAEPEQVVNQSDEETASVETTIDDTTALQDTVELVDALTSTESLSTLEPNQEEADETSIWDSLKETASEGWNNVTETFTDVKETITEAWDNSVSAIDHFFTGPDSTATDEEAATSINANDIEFEILAHQLAYHGQVPQEFKETVEKLGYQPEYVEVIDDASTGFFCAVLKPTNPEESPLIIFRGTEPSNGINELIKDLSTDLDVLGSGYQQYKANQEQIKALVDAYASESNTGKVNVTGHSLGGGLAQYTTIDNAEKIERTITFQSAGLSESMVEEGNKNLENLPEDDRPEIVHHRGKGDVVPAPGEHLDGDFYVHDVEGSNPLATHGTNLLATPGFEEQYNKLQDDDDKLNLKDWTALGVEKSNKDRDIEKFDEHPVSPFFQNISEGVRAGVGLITLPGRLLYRGINEIKEATEDDIPPEKQNKDRDDIKDVTSPQPESGSTLKPQLKLAVNRPGDIYEQEADAVADQVMRMPVDNGKPASIKGRVANLGHLGRVMYDASAPPFAIQREADGTPSSETPAVEQNSSAMIRVDTDSHAIQTPRDEMSGESEGNSSNPEETYNTDATLPDSKITTPDNASAEEASQEELDNATESGVSVTPDNHQSLNNYDPDREVVPPPIEDRVVEDLDEEAGFEFDVEDEVFDRFSDDLSEVEAADPASVLAEEATQIDDALVNLTQSLVAELPQQATEAQDMMQAFANQESDALAETMPTKIRTPLGVPTLPEITGEEDDLVPETRFDAVTGLVEEETPTFEPFELYTEKGEQNHVTNAQTTRTRLKQQGAENDKTARDAQPDRAKTTSNVSTWAGPRPKVQLTGATDPIQIEQKQRQADIYAKGEFDVTQTAIQQNYGENEIYPPEAAELIPLERDFRSPKVDLSKLAIDSEEDDDSRHMVDQPLSNVAPTEVAQFLNENQTTQADHQAAVESDWTELQEQLTTLQTTQQEEVSAIQEEHFVAIQEEKEAWALQNQTLLDEYRTLSEETRDTGEEDIERTVLEGEREIDTLMTNAENEAKKKKSQAEGKATDRMNKGRQAAASALGSVGLPLKPTYEAKIVGTVMRTASSGESDKAAKEKAAKEKAEAELAAAEAEAARIIAEMEAEVQRILDDASLTAAQKAAAIEATVNQAISDVGQVLDKLAGGDYGPYSQEALQEQATNIMNTAAAGVYNVIQNVVQHADVTQALVDRANAPQMYAGSPDLIYPDPENPNALYPNALYPSAGYFGNYGALGMAGKDAYDLWKNGAPPSTTPWGAIKGGIMPGMGLTFAANFADFIEAGQPVNSTEFVATNIADVGTGIGIPYAFAQAGGYIAGPYGAIGGGIFGAFLDTGYKMGAFGDDIRPGIIDTIDTGLEAIVGPDIEYGSNYPFPTSPDCLPQGGPLYDFDPEAVMEITEPFESGQTITYDPNFEPESDLESETNQATIGPTHPPANWSLPDKPTNPNAYDIYPETMTEATELFESGQTVTYDPNFESGLNLEPETNQATIGPTNPPANWSLPDDYTQTNPNTVESGTESE